MGISEIQCYEHETIMGEARLQDEDSGAEHYDSGNLLDRYGIITYVARGGQPDEMLSTETKADADASFILDEIVRLTSAIDIHAPWLPGIPVFSTIRIQTGALGNNDVAFFVESRDASEDGDSLRGTTLP